MSDDETREIPVLEEKLIVQKRKVSTGRVRVSTKTETIDTLAEALLETDSVEVTRVPMDRRVEDFPETRTEGDLLIVPVVEERLVVEKQLFLLEEIHIRRNRGSERVQVPMTIRKQHAEIERIGPGEDDGEETAEIARKTPMTEYGNTTSTSTEGNRGQLAAFFDRQADAEQAIERLVDRGVPRDSIRLMPGAEADAPQREPRGFFESLADLFMPNEDRQVYAEGLSRGGYLVTVTNLSQENYEPALDILDEAGAIDLDERTDSWRSEGWSGYDSAAAATAATGGVAYGAAGYDETRAAGYDESGKVPRPAEVDRPADEPLATAALGGQAATTPTDPARATGLAGEDETVPIVQERLVVGKRDVSHGRVRVRSYVVEEPVSEEVELSAERVALERRPVDRALTDGDDAFRERVIEAEEHAEEAVVSKEARVVEEVGIRREQDTRRETVSDNVRRTEVEIEDDRTASDGSKLTDEKLRDTKQTDPVR